MKDFIKPLGIVLAAVLLAAVLTRLAPAQSGVYSPGAIPLNNTPTPASYSTWANGPTGHIDMTKSPLQYASTNAMAITGFDNAPAVGYETTVITWWTNSSASDITLYVTAAGYTASDGSRSFVITNKSQRVIALQKNDMGYHGQAASFY